MTAPVVYIDRSRILPGKIDELRRAIDDLVAFIRAEEPQLVHYGFYLDEEDLQMTVVAVHPDPTSVERHMDVGGSAFRALGEYIDMAGIEIFGPTSQRMLDQLHDKASALGEEGRVSVHPPDAGFSNLPPRTRPLDDDQDVRRLPRQ
jgi:quinol monooxygenase YgiN